MKFQITGLITLPNSPTVTNGQTANDGQVQMVDPIARLTKFEFDILNERAILTVLYFTDDSQTLPTHERTYDLAFPILQSTQDPTIAAIQAMFDGLLQSQFQGISIHALSTRLPV
jgi:hypothetical protein